MYSEEIHPESSFPTLGTWIEIANAVLEKAESESFPTLGTWIEINVKFVAFRLCNCRSLHWERGLKYVVDRGLVLCLKSFPTLGTWIEILP